MDNNEHLVHLHDLLMTGNSTEIDGGAFCAARLEMEEDVYKTTQVRISNSLIYGNFADDDAGGVFVEAGVLELINTTIYDNTCTDDGGAVAMKPDSSGTIVNSILAKSEGCEALHVDEAASITVSYSAFWDNPDGVSQGIDSPVGQDGNINADPLFVDPAEGDFHLQTGSPAINAGDPNLADPDGSRSDMGTYGGPNAP